MIGFDLDVIASSENDTDQNVLVDTRSKTKRPPLYKVLLLNDELYADGIRGLGA